MTRRGYDNQQDIIQAMTLSLYFSFKSIEKLQDIPVTPGMSLVLGKQESFKQYDQYIYTLSQDPYYKSSIT